MASFLREAGYEAIDVRDTGLRGAKDKEILEYAIQQGATVITADVGFSSLFFLSSIQHNGLVLLRVPNSFTVGQTIGLLLRSLKVLTDKDIIGNIIVLEQQKIRIRRHRGRY
jgi:predicted nuclease of predicted toxin-antitoxin system